MKPKRQQLEALCKAALDTYDSGARLTQPEAIYFANSVRILDIDAAYRTLKTAKERFNLKHGDKNTHE